MDSLTPGYHYEGNNVLSEDKFFLSGRPRSSTDQLCHLEESLNLLNLCFYVYKDNVTQIYLLGWLDEAHAYMIYWARLVLPIPTHTI